MDVDICVGFTLSSPEALALTACRIRQTGGLNLQVEQGECLGA